MAEKQEKVRYAVVGLGHIAQAAVLPAFQHASKNSELAALVSGDDEKLQTLGKTYNIEHLYHYREFEKLLESQMVDAVYIATPNTYHRRFAELSADYGVHILCEKPMAVSTQECLSMIDACRANEVRLMIAYRLHFEEANLHVIDLIRKGAIGEPKVFNSVFTLQVRDPNNIRLDREKGGGTLYDIGIYCINAARNIFNAEPIEVTAISANSETELYQDVDEMTGATLCFPDGQLATFTTCFSARSDSSFDVVGTNGSLRLESCYDYNTTTTLKMTNADGKTTEKQWNPRDQFAPELLHFSDCILNDRDPQPNGLEGYADVRIIQALYRSADLGQTVHLNPLRLSRRPRVEDTMTIPPVDKPKTVNVRGPREG